MKNEITNLKRNAHKLQWKLIQSILRMHNVKPCIETLHTARALKLSIPKNVIALESELKGAKI